MKTILLRLQPQRTGLHYQETKSGNPSLTGLSERRGKGGLLNSVPIWY